MQEITGLQLGKASDEWRQLSDAYVKVADHISERIKFVRKRPGDNYCSAGPTLNTYIGLVRLIKWIRETDS